MKLKKTFSQWKARMKQLMEFDNLPLYKSIFDYVKGYEDKLLGLKLDEGEIADKVMKFWLLPVIDTSKEKYTDFEVKRESSNRIQLVLEHCHSAELKAKPFEVDLDLDFEMKEALGLNNTSELERRGQPSNTNFKLNKIMQLVTNSIYKKLNQESPKEYAKSVAVEKADVSVQVDVPRILTPLSQPPPIERLYTPRKQEQVYSPPKHNEVSSFSDVKYNQYRTLDNYNRRAMLTISDSMSTQNAPQDFSSPGTTSVRFEKSYHMDKYVRPSLRTNYKFINSTRVAPLRPSRSKNTSRNSRNDNESTISVLEKNQRKFDSERVNFNLSTPIKFDKYRY